MIDLPLELQLLHVLEYSLTVKEILFGILGVLFLKMVWEFVGKIVRFIFKRKKSKLELPIFTPEKLRELKIIEKEDKNG